MTSKPSAWDYLEKGLCEAMYHSSGILRMDASERIEALIKTARAMQVEEIEAMRDKVEECDCADCCDSGKRKMANDILATIRPKESEGSDE